MSRNISHNKVATQIGIRKYIVLILIGIALIMVGLGCNLWQNLFSSNTSNENQTIEITSIFTDDEDSAEQNQAALSASKTSKVNEGDESTIGALETSDSFTETPTITPTVLASKTKTPTGTKTDRPTITERIKFNTATITPSKTKIPPSRTPTETNTRIIYTHTPTPSSTALPPTESPTITTTPEPSDTPCPPT